MSDTFDHFGDAFYNELDLKDTEQDNNFCFSDLEPDTEEDIAYREELKKRDRASILVTKEQLVDYFARSKFKKQDLVMTPDRGPGEIVGVTMGLDRSYWYKVRREGWTQERYDLSYKEIYLKDYWGKDWREQKAL